MKRRTALAAIALAPLARPPRTAWVEFRGRNLCQACRRVADAGVDTIVVGCKGKPLLRLERRGGSWVLPVGDTVLPVEL